MCLYHQLGKICLAATLPLHFSATACFQQPTTEIMICIDTLKVCFKSTGKLVERSFCTVSCFIIFASLFCFWTAWWDNWGIMTINTNHLMSLHAVHILIRESLFKEFLMICSMSNSSLHQNSIFAFGENFSKERNGWCADFSWKSLTYIFPQPLECKSDQF